MQPRRDGSCGSGQAELDDGSPEDSGYGVFGAKRDLARDPAGVLLPADHPA